MKHLSWFSLPVGALMGYGYASVCIIEALQRKKIRVDFDKEIAPVGINFIQPEYYKTYKKQYKIGYTPWESTVIPDAWRYLMESQDELWTTSQFCKEVYANYDIDTTVVPHGIDPEVFKIQERTLVDKFIFYHIGSPTEGKGSQRVVDAFLDLFDGQDDKMLVLKSTGETNARWTDKKGFYHGNAGNHPQIQVVKFDLTVEDMSHLYNIAHCFVYPSNGEGFGLIPFQAMATGIPILVTNGTGMKDFAHYGLPLKCEPEEAHGIHLGMWDKPDEQHLRELMQHVVDNWEAENKRAIQNARIIHATQTWDIVADQIVDLIGDKIESQSIMYPN